MQTKATPKRALALLLTLALLTVSLTVLLPVAASADQEIQNFSYQTVVGDGVSSSSTQLRFVFTIGKLEYIRAGFVFSLSNDNPTVGGDDCHVYDATTAYRSITADSVTTPAPDGRWWVVVKLTDIGHVSFDTTIYVSAFVQDGEGIRYETTSITVLEAFDFDMHICKQSNIAGSTLQISKTLDLIQNGDHFYPTNENPNGKDAYFEVALLWNPTMANYGNDCFHLCLNYQGAGQANFYYFYPKDDASSAYCKFAGGFDYGADGGANPIIYGPAGTPGLPKEGYPNVGEYGWHMVGVRFHQAAALDNGNVVYSGTSYLYIDGELVWQVNLNITGKFQGTYKEDGQTKEYKNFLFIATNNGGVLEYEDNPNANRVRMQLRGEKAAGTTDPFYLIYHNASWSVVPTDFEPTVEPVADPAASTITINGRDFADAFYFAPKN